MDDWPHPTLQVTPLEKKSHATSLLFKIDTNVSAKGALPPNHTIE